MPRSENMATFPIFNSFPPEIHSLILSSCPPNDFICLRLTCKYLYDLSQSLPVSKVPVPLTNTDLGPVCDNTPLDYWGHRSKCHALSHAVMGKSYRKAGLVSPRLKKCRARGWHCECFTRRFRLHHRLRNWMPKGLNYCKTCDKFTRRKRGHKGRCYHGRPKLRRQEGNYWTHVSGNGAFGRKVWKKWFNNAAMNRLEDRLGRENDRDGNKRYELRRLEPKIVNTKEIRDNYSKDY